MSDDIVDRLRSSWFDRIGEHSADCWQWHIECACQRSADEIERLRALITEWVDATTDGGVMYQGITQRWWDAKEALRQAVGR
jgi:hypothetical protein